MLVVVAGWEEDTLVDAGVDLLGVPGFMVMDGNGGCLTWLGELGVRKVTDDWLSPRAGSSWDESDTDPMSVPCDWDSASLALPVASPSASCCLKRG